MKTEKQVERRLKAIEAAVFKNYQHNSAITTAREHRAYTTGALYGALYALGWVFGGGRWPSWITKPEGKREAKKAQP